MLDSLVSALPKSWQDKVKGILAQIVISDTPAAGV